MQIQKETLKELKKKEPKIEIFSVKNKNKNVLKKIEQKEKTLY